MNLSASHAARRAIFRQPQIINPYWDYVRHCVWIVVGSLMLSAIGLWFSPPWQILLPVLGLTCALILAISALILRPYARLADQRIVEARESCQACWTYSSQAWNQFATYQRDSIQSETLIPIALFPTCTFSIGLVLGLLEGWVWLALSLVIGFVLALPVSVLNRQIRERRYKEVRGATEILISPGLLAVPGYTFIWNGVAPKLIDIEIHTDEQFDYLLVFHYVCHAGHNFRRGTNLTHRSMILPVPPGKLPEAEAIVAGFHEEGEADDDWCEQEFEEECLSRK